MEPPHCARIHVYHHAAPDHDTHFILKPPSGRDSGKRRSWPVGSFHDPSTVPHLSSQRLFLCQHPRRVETHVSAAGETQRLLKPLLRTLRICSLPVLMQGTINWDGVFSLRYLH